MRLALIAVLTLAAAGSSGCHSPYVAATVVNRTGQPIELLEVDYPSASFGTQNLASGAEFHYRFKVLGSGGTKLIYTDGAHKDHNSTGPELKEGAEGKLIISVGPAGVIWKADPSLGTSK